MAIDTYRKDVAPPPTPTPENAGGRFAKTMQDRESEDSGLFAKWVESGTDPDLAQRFASGAMVAGDQEKLKKGFEGFEKRKAKVMEMTGQMTAEQMQNFGSRSPLLKDAIELGGADKIAEVFKDHLVRLAFEQPAEFANLETQFGALNSFRQGAFKTFDDDITSRYEALGITEQRYSKIMQMPDEKARLKAFKSEVKETFGWFGKPNDWRFKAKELASAKDKSELDRLVKDLQVHEDEVGSALGLLADKNDTIRKAVNQELLGMREKPGKLISLGGASDALKKFQKSVDMGAERAKFYKTQGYDTAGKTPAEKATITRNFNDSMDKKFRESMKDQGGGKWLEIILALFGMKLRTT